MRTLLGHRASCTLLCAACLFDWTASAIGGPSPGKKRDATVVSIERTVVESSSLVSVGFAKQARILEIEFRSGAIYRYFAVPPTIFEEFKRADSKGRYFTQSIRGRYQFQRVETASK